MRNSAYGVGRATRVGMLVSTSVVASAALMAAGPAANAGSVGDWTQVSDFPASAQYPRAKSIDEPTVGRLGDGLQIIWPGQASVDRMALYTAVVNRDGATTTSARQIIGDWATLAHDPRLIRVNGQQFLAFSGLQSTNTGAPYTSGAEYAATSGDGLTWSVNAGSLSASTSAYAAYGNDAVDNAGTPAWVGVPGTSSGITWHLGLAPTDPAPAGSDATFRLQGCCAYASATARDESTGAVYASFYSNSDAPGENGIWAGQILPGQGAFARLIGSSATSNASEDSIDPGQRVAMVARHGGGVFVAFKMGYPRVSGIRITNVASGATLDVPGSAGASRISLAAGEAGRLWVSWIAGGKVKVAHSDAAVTQMGAVGTFGAPRGSSDLWKLVADSSAGSDERVDLVLSAGAANGRVNVWHTQALRTLTVNVQARVRRGADMVIRVTDAGEPVPGARVTLGSRTATTDASGTARLQAPSRTGRYRVSATATGYSKGMGSIVVN